MTYTFYSKFMWLNYLPKYAYIYHVYVIIKYVAYLSNSRASEACET